MFVYFFLFWPVVHTRSLPQKARGKKQKKIISGFTLLLPIPPPQSTKENYGDQYDFAPSRWPTNSRLLLRKKHWPSPLVFLL